MLVTLSIGCYNFQYMDQRSKIAILGFGVEGKAILEWLMIHKYHHVTICDRNVDLGVELPKGVSVRLGEHYLNDLGDFEVVFRSPGLSPLKPELQAAKIAGVEVTSTTNFFMDQCKAEVIGVTGTKGKGTTSTLIYEMLKKDGRKSGVDLFLGGNIGTSPMEFLDKVEKDDLVILELSSFQLQDLEKAPKFAVLLNTTIDHLDYHVDQEEYMEAKERILSRQGSNDVAVLNKDYEYVKYYQPLVRGELKWVSRKGPVENGAYVEDGWIWRAENGEKKKLLEVAEVALVGSHNLENILPAICIASELGVSAEKMAEVIREFKNLPYRLQFVRELNGVKFYNDSYSTNGDTSVAAVDSFDVPTVLIAGGSDKGIDYNDWARRILLKPTLHTVVLIGQTGDKMEKALIEAEGELEEEGADFAPTKILRRNRMEDAVVDAYAECDGDSVVVLSPAAASFDMYKNYKERGNDFVAHVRKLK